MKAARMRAVGLRTYGGPEVLTTIELPVPEPGRGEVRVRVRAAAVNPADVMLRDGRLADFYPGVEPPFVPGMDVTGVVDLLGPDIDPSFGLSMGQEVVGIVDNVGAHGGYSDYVVLPAESVTAAPKGSTLTEASTFLMPALTARCALDELALAKGDTLVVTGAAGAVGRFAVALAHDDGIRVVAVAAQEDAELLASLGADDVVARSAEPAAGIRELLPEGAAAVLDCAGLNEAILPALRDGSGFADIRAQAVPPGRGITVHPVNVRERARDHAAIVRLREQVETGVLALSVEATFPAEQAELAHRRQDEGHVRGRVVLLFDEPVTAAS